jgi:2-keto-4-pentenoate hydratase/2-oxohepta-3-ene-1,7-dioic acid hydratase in catechol pathway
MKIVVFGPDARVGAIDGDAVVDLHATDAAIPPTLLGLIEAGPAGIAAAEAAVRRGTVKHAIESVALQAPWPRKRIACAGGNFAAHSYGMAVNNGVEGVTIETQAKRIRTDGLWGFWKVLDEVAGPGDTVPYPNRATYFDYEGEVAIVIGKRGKDIDPSRVADYIWGVTLANDWSVRDAEKTPQRPVSLNFAKNFDRSVSLGPCIVVGELDASHVPVETRLDGELRQQFDTSDMVFTFGEFLAHISRDFTLVPGDVVLGGTGAGTAQDSSKRNPDRSFPTDRFLRRGQTVAVSSPGIGTLTNTIV